MADEMLQGMQERLKQLEAEKAALQKEFQSLRAQCEEDSKAMGSKPRETEQDIDKKIKDKEHYRVTKSMPLSEEKKLLREIDLLKKQKVAVKAYMAKDETFVALKNKKNAVFESLKGKEAALAEVGAAVKKLQVAQRCGVAADELVTITVEVPESHVSRVIGKGGANLRKIEETCKVTVDLDSGKKQGNNTARVSGSAAACALAKEKIEEVTQSVLEEVPVSEPLAQMLVVNKGAEINKLLTECNVRIDLARDEGLLKVNGLPANIAKARARLAILEQSMRRATLPVEKRLVFAVVGKGGANIRRLEEAYGVSVDVPRDGGEVAVSGFAEKVAGAVAELEELLATHADKEAAVPVDRFAARLLMAEDGKVVKELRKATGCLVYMDLKKEAERGQVGIRGPGFRLEEAVAAVRAALAEIEGSTEAVEVGVEMVRYVIGKKGAVINALREGTGATIETDTATGRVRIYSPDAAVRAQAKAELTAVLEKNQGSEVSLPREGAIALKGKSGQALREKAAKELEVQMEISVDDTAAGGDDGSCVRLRGSAEAMAAVRAELLAFAEENYGAEMVLLPDMYPMLVSGGEESIRRQVERATGVALFPLKDEGVLKLRGPRAAVEAAEAAVRKALDGEDEAEGTSAVVPCHPDAIPGLIGKGGAGAAKFREEHGCHLMVLKARDQIRVRGSDPTKVTSAAAALRKLLAEQRVAALVPAKDWQMEALEGEGEGLGEFRRLYDVGMEVKPNEGFRVRGLVAEVSAAKQRLAELVTKRGKAAVELAPGQLAQVPEGEWAGVREAYGVALDVDGPGDRVLLQGGAEAVRRARAHVFGLLAARFPGGYGQVEVAGGEEAAALAALAQPQALAAFRAQTGAEAVWLDREEGLVRVRGPAPAVAAAAGAVTAFVKGWAASRASVAFDAPWMLPILVGKGGSKVKELEAAHGVTVSVDRDAGVIRLAVPVPAAGDEEAAAAALAAAKAALEKDVETVRSQHAEMRVPPEAIPSLVGRGGQRIAKIREESGATIDVLSSTGASGGNGNGANGGAKGGKGKGGGGNGRPQREVAVEGGSNVRLRGAPEAIDKAQELIEALVTEWLQSNMTQSVAVPHPEQQFGLIVGRGGATVKAIAEESGGARLEMDREKGVVVVRGSAEQVAAAAAAVQKLLEEDAAQNAQRYAEAAAAREAQQQQQQQQQRKGGHNGGGNKAHGENGHGPNGGADALHDSANSASSVISSATAPVPAGAATAAPEWNFPTVPPGADPAMARQLLERQQGLAAAAAGAGGKGKRRKRTKGKKDEQGGNGGVEEPVQKEKEEAPAPVERSKTPVAAAVKEPSVPTTAAAAPADDDGFVEVKPKGKKGKVPEKQSALLDMVLGDAMATAAAAAAPGPAPAQAAIAVAVAANGGAVPPKAVSVSPVPPSDAAPPEPSKPAVAGNYFKSSSGFSIRL